MTTRIEQSCEMNLVNIYMTNMRESSPKVANMRESSQYLPFTITERLEDAEFKHALTVKLETQYVDHQAACCLEAIVLKSEIMHTVRYVTGNLPESTITDFTGEDQTVSEKRQSQREKFAKVDVNDDGVLDKSELAKMMNGLSRRKSALESLELLDINGDGAVTIDEFMVHYEVLQFMVQLCRCLPW